MRSLWRWRLPPRLLEWWQRLARAGRGRVRTTAQRLAIGVVILLVVSYLGLEATSHPRFCVTCHYMRPYYEAWQASTHSDVACLDCHYPPGVKSALWRKIGASVQVLKYITRQYGVRPFTEIDDRSCLRSGCHERRLLRGKVDFGGVVFDHAPHLGSFRRVTQLRCTACHSQIVQGTHMTVTDTACFLCHFKDPQKTPSVAQCAICHKQAKLAGEERKSKFDHAGLQARGVACDECHSGVTRGQGPVPRDRCYECHGEEERVARYHQVEFMHLNHVTEHKVECTRCHQEIEHSIPRPQAPAALDCLSCHPNQHAATQKLYAGMGGEGVQAEPDPMAEADVSCVSCHRTHGKLGTGSVLRAGAAGCMNCHGEAYGRLLAAWLATADTQVARIQAALEVARGEVAGRAPSSSERAPADELLDSAQAVTELVRAGGGVHNIEFAKALLEAARQQINESMRLVGSSYRVGELPVASVPASKGVCLDCHPQPPAQDVRVFGTAFSHAQHLWPVNFDCQRCHADGDVASPSHGKLKIGAAGCRRCHRGKVKKPHPRGWPKTHGQASLGQRASCTVCHSSSYCSNCHGLDMPHPATWTTKHGKRALTDAVVCTKCHQTKHCTSCHVPAQQLVPSTHTEDWPQTHGAAAAVTRSACQLCHGQNACEECHKKNPHPEGFALQHTERSRQRPSSCLVCHQREYCKLCHTDPPSSHTAAFRDDHRAPGEANRALCVLCHEEDPCMGCHQTEMPHRGNYMLDGHPKEGSLEPDSFCFKCHDPKRYCAICHQDEL